MKNSDPQGYIAEVMQVVPVVRELFATKPARHWPSKEEVFVSYPELQALANKLVSALGYCRIYGIQLPKEVDQLLTGQWPRELIVAAVEELKRILKVATEHASSLPRDFDEAEPLEDRDYCMSVLHLAMETWAMFVAIDEQYQLHLDRGDGLDMTFSRIFNELQDALDSFDTQVQKEEQMKLLSIATELPLLENWRSMLAEPFRTRLPWWLDGELEAKAEQVRQEIESDQTFQPRLDV